MTAIAKTLMNEIATKVQIGTAACAIAVAAAFPAVVANAEPAVPAPIAPVTQILAEPILGPAHIAEQNLGWWFGDGNSPTVVNSFQPLVFAAVGVFILPIVAVFAAVAAVVGTFFRIGPYGTGRS